MQSTSGISPIQSIEDYLDKLVTILQSAHAAIRKAAQQIKRAELSARGGDIAALKKAVDEAQIICSRITTEIHKCTIDPSTLTSAVEKQGFLEEIARLGSAAGIHGLRVTEGKLTAFPYVLGPPVGFTMAFGSKKLRSIRPSVVAAEIARSRERSAIPEKKLLEAVGRVCQHSRNAAVGISLFDVYESLTPLPGQQNMYTIEDFFAGVCRLATSGPHRYNGAILEFPAPGSGARRVKTMIGPDGRTARFGTVRLIPSVGPLGV